MAKNTIASAADDDERRDETKQTDETKDASEAGKALGKLGASKGGKARAEKLTPEQRSAIAKQAVEARWAKAKGVKPSASIPVATHSGTLKIGDIELPCAVLEDGTRVFTQEGMLTAIGRSKPRGGQGSGQTDQLPPFLSPKNLKPFISKDLEYATKPLFFRPQSATSGSGNLLPGNRGVATGYRVELLPMVCHVYLDARSAGALKTGVQNDQTKIASRCEMLIRGLATVGIIALVDEATGYQYDRPRRALEEILEKFLKNELGAWARRFPNEFYEHLFRLRGYQHHPGSNKRPMLFAQLTVDLVYQRLAPGVLEEMRRRSPKDMNGKRKNALHQWLSDDFGIPKLRDHFIKLDTLMEGNDKWDSFYRQLNRVLPKFNFTKEFSFMNETEDESKE